jgi:hypothetical protein
MDSAHIADVVDRMAIIDQLSRYCLAVDFGDWEALESIFAVDVDATYLLGPHGLDDVHRDDRAGIIGWLRSVLGESSVQAPVHAMTNHLVTVDGDAGRSSSYLANGGGTYEAEWRRTPDGWRATRWEMRNYGVPESVRRIREAASAKVQRSVIP